MSPEIHRKATKKQKRINYVGPHHQYNLYPFLLDLTLTLPEKQFNISNFRVIHLSDFEKQRLFIRGFLSYWNSTVSYDLYQWKL